MKHLISLLMGILILGVNSELFSLPSEYEKATQYLEERGEVYFKFFDTSPSLLNNLTYIISLDKIDNTGVYAYANKEGFQKFSEHDLYYEVQTPPGLLYTPKMMDYKPGHPIQWDSYPRFNDYLLMLEEFETTYPDLVKVFEYGTSINGYELKTVKVSDNVNEKEREPEFLATSSIHGDETLGIVLMLRMIEYLCQNYQSDTKVTQIVDNAELWICPVTNPDGTYRGGQSISSPQRMNVNGKDLNRNHPGPSSQYGLYNSWEKEVRAILDLEAEHNFIMGMDIHGGMECGVYPWAYTRLYPKDRYWFEYVCGNYAETVWDNASSGYFRTKPKGYGCAGIDFYTAPGTRMDGPYWYSHFRCITLELHSTKFLPESQLESHWGYNMDALLDLFLEVTYGIQGLVTDSGGPVDVPLNDVKVWVENYDEDSTFNRTDTNGMYFRPMEEGTYTLTFSKENYYPTTVSDVTVEYGKPTILNVKLWNGTDINSNQKVLNKSMISIVPYNKGFKINYRNNNENALISIYNIKGKTLRTFTNGSMDKQSIMWDGKDNNGQFISNGCYIIKIKNKGGTVTTSFIVNR